MRKSILMTFILCFLSTQVLGSVVYEDDHKQLGDLHGLIHELGHPHTHDDDHENNESEFELSYTTEAMDHVGQDADCCVVALVNTSPLELSDKKPSGDVIWYTSNWSPPFLQHIKPPPRH